MVFLLVPSQVYVFQILEIVFFQFWYSYELEIIPTSSFSLLSYLIVDDLFEMLRDFSFSFPMLYYSNENAYFR